MNPGDDHDPDAPAMVKRIGIVRLASRSPATVPAVDANFLPIGVSGALADVRAELMPSPGECRLASDSRESIRDAAPGIDAGETLTLTDANGTYARIERSGSMENGFVYRLNRGAVVAPEAGLVLDVPGGDLGEGPFVPATAVAFPIVQGVPALRAPLAQTLVLPDSVYRWDAAAMADAGEQPFLLLAINVGDVITNSVLCALSEGGEFVLPQATLSALDARGEIGPDGGIGSVFGFGAMRTEERRLDDETLLLLRHMRFVELPRG